jgi:hypothetical protein
VSVPVREGASAEQWELELVAGSVAVWGCELGVEWAQVMGEQLVPSLGWVLAE